MAIKQATHLLGTPALGRAVVIEEELAFALVVDDIRIALHELLQFLFAGGNGEGSTIGAFHAEAVIRANRFDLGDLLRVELSHGEAQSTGMAPLLARYQGVALLNWASR